VIRKTLFAVAVLAAVIFGANCSFEPQACVTTANTFFEGCFEGEVTDPADGGKFRIILDNAGNPSSSVLGGCLDLTLASGREIVPLSGGVSCSISQEANLTGVKVGGTNISIHVVRNPAAGNAVTLDVTTSDEAFTSALALPRCTVVMTCPDTSIRMPFGTGEQP
jgi:hypothetical protein